MSGGHFDYNQYKIHQFADEVEQLIRINDLCEKNEHGETKGYNFSPDTITEFKAGLDILRMGAVYAQRIDWLVCGDDGENSFHSRLREDMQELKLESRTNSSNILELNEEAKQVNSIMKHDVVIRCPDLWFSRTHIPSGDTSEDYLGPNNCAGWAQTQLGDVMILAQNRIAELNLAMPGLWHYKLLGWRSHPLSTD